MPGACHATRVADIWDSNVAITDRVKGRLTMQSVTLMHVRPVCPNKKAEGEVERTDGATND